MYPWASSFCCRSLWLLAFSELHGGVQVRPLVTHASLVSSVACIPDAEPPGFRMALAVHRLPCLERRDASTASREDHGRILEGGNA